MPGMFVYDLGRMRMESKMLRARPMRALGTQPSSTARNAGLDEGEAGKA